jgi:hypothetical protein
VGSEVAAASGEARGFFFERIWLRFSFFFFSFSERNLEGKKKESRETILKLYTR